MQKSSNSYKEKRASKA